MEVDQVQNNHVQEESKIFDELIGQRIHLKNQCGSILYVGMLKNNPKAGTDIWLGIEWDEEGQGKHNGTVDGVKYFECEFHRDSPNFELGQTNCCSFLRYGKVQIGGVNLREAIIDKYRPEDMMSTEEKEKLKLLENEELYVNTDKKGMKKIEVLGQEQSYEWRSDPRYSKEISLEMMKISDLGPSGGLKEMFPNVMYLYLDKNLLHSWDQFYQLTRELRYLSILTLTGNRFRRIDKSYMNNKRVEELIHPFLTELVLIDMGLDWGQIDILAPTFVYVEQLHLVRNKCNKICTQYEISKDSFRNLKFINLEQNGIESWDEIVGFRNLPVLKRLTVSKNRLRDLYYKPGFRDLYMVSMEDNIFTDWRAFDALNQFNGITVLRCGGNPVFENLGSHGRQIVIARLQFLKNLNGSQIEEGERKDCEVLYLKRAYEDFIKEHKLDKKVEDLQDERLLNYMIDQHPRWYELVEKYGSPLEMVNLKQEGTNIASTSAKIKLKSFIPSTHGKELEKKLLLSMTVGQVKAMCTKFFKVDLIKMTLIYHEESCEAYELDEDLRQLSYYSIRDAGEIWVEIKQ